MNRLPRPSSGTPTDEAVGRGRDAGDLARIRDRLAAREDALASDVATALEGAGRQREDELRADAEIAAIEEAARVQEQANGRRVARVLAQQAAFGLGTFAIVGLLREAINRLGKGSA